MKIAFVFPADPLEPGVDAAFTEQAAELIAAGFPVWTFRDGKILTKGQSAQEQTVIYRGWMLSAEEYRTFLAAVEKIGATALTGLDEYLLCHHIPNWYPLLKDFTAQTAFFGFDIDLNKQLFRLKEAGWSGFLIKDWVKSLKGIGNITSLISNPDEGNAILEQMKKFGLTGGLSVRRYEDYERFEKDISYLMEEFVVLSMSPACLCQMLCCK